MTRSANDLDAIRAARPPLQSRLHRHAFTLVELIVVLLVILILAAMTLGGLAVARTRTKIDVTRNTIRKIHELVMPQYESYQRRRVPFMAAPNGALSRLVNVRRLVVREMPDCWGDVWNNFDQVKGDFAAVTSGSTYRQTGPVLAYAAMKAALGPTVVTGSAEGAECLYMIVSRGLGEPDAMEQFRADEIGDTDKDGAPEFLDAWNQPIGFMRWAPGFSKPLSPVQVADAANFHDPLDPLRVDPTGYALIPLIVSLGPDKALGLVAPSIVWNAATLDSIVAGNTSLGGADGSGTHLDNITNHDLTSKR